MASKVYTCLKALIGKRFTDSKNRMNVDISLKVKEVFDYGIYSDDN